MKKMIILAFAILPMLGMAQSELPGLQVYSRFDFVPGEQVLYLEDFSQDLLGEMPLKWITNNRGETVKIQQSTQKWMRIFPDGSFISPLLKKLPENFTVELDLLVQFNGEGGYTYPEIAVKLLELLPSDLNAASYMSNQDAVNEIELSLLPGGNELPLSSLLQSYHNGNGFFSNARKELKKNSDNAAAPLHICIWVQKERIRYWINADKIYDIPKAVPDKARFNRIGFNIPSSLYQENELGIYVSNIKIAAGDPDIRSKLIKEGKLITSGIQFDVNSAKIKPQSIGVIRGIATALKENPTVRILIKGHTDSDGDNNRNLTLSRERAAAVKQVLSTQFGIDQSRMETEGKGASMPLVSNQSNEGKAQNRRVEFIVLLPGDPSNEPA